jgi:hypothetical protein
MKKEIPEIGKYYHFFDDGKTSPSRHYICRCEKVITPEAAKQVIVRIPEWHYNNEVEYCDISLYDHWHDNEMPFHNWLYAEDTDYFVECSCPRYDENNLWFVRTKNGGWFSMNIQNSWQSGRLDIDNTIYNERIKEALEDNIFSIDDYPEATQDNWELSQK